MEDKTWDYSLITRQGDKLQENVTRIYPTTDTTRKYLYKCSIETMNDFIRYEGRLDKIDALTSGCIRWYQTCERY